MASNGAAVRTGDGDGRPAVRLSSGLEQLRPREEVVVVGSGYGGAVLASRLARAGRSVAVFERGTERHPGDFPTTLGEGRRELQVRSARGGFGRRTALFDLRIAAGQSVLVGCGLGGTSLINANVALRAAPRIFDDDRWPAQLRVTGRETLDPYYDRAEGMLGSRPYPVTWPELAKVEALAAGAASLGAELEHPPINVTFSAGANAAGVRQEACTLCGDCCAGCNVGAKNNVLANYLPDAHAHGARIFTEAAVVRLRRDEGCWLVDLMPTADGRSSFRAPPLTVVADVVVLAAGTLGSSEILLRSREAGLGLSELVGEHFNGNGDVLGFAHDAAHEVDAVGWGARPTGRAVGPTIAGRIKLTNPDTTDEVTVEEGAVPGMLAPVVTLGVAVANLARRDLPVAERAGQALRSARNATRRTLTYLVMSTDDGDGRLRLGRRGVEVDWLDVGREPVIASDNEDLQRAAAAIGGEYLAQPAWSKQAGYSLITVHPLGGCVMGDDATDGVVDDRGRVFASTTGSAVHDGLYVVDGSIVPRPLDVNPLLTISALAERAAEGLIAERGWEASSDAVAPLRTPDAPPLPSAAPAPPPALGGPPDPARLWFTERMAGWLAPAGAVTLAPSRLGRPVGSSPVEFVLTIASERLDLLLADPATAMTLVGTVSAPLLDDAPLLVQNGSFHLLEPVPDEVETWHMHYEMDLVANDGRRFHFDGHKVIRDGPVWKLWPETTTLYVTVTDEAGGRVGVGVLRIRPADFARQLSTIRATAPNGRAAARRYELGFLKLFLGRLFHVFGGLADQLGRYADAPDPHAPPDAGGRPLRLPEPEIAWAGADGSWHDVDVPAAAAAAGLDPVVLVEAGKVPVGDDAFVRLTRYHGGDKGPVLLASGFGMAARAFLGRTTEANLAEYLVEHGYDVWLFDYRASIDLPSSHTSFTLDDVALADWPAAVAEVRARTGAETVQAFGHCVGSSSLLMALGAGLDGVRSAVCSQFSLHPHTSTLNKVKCTLRVSTALHRLGMRGVEPDDERRPLNVVMDLALHLVPEPRGEACGQPICRFINSIYGLTHAHSQLNEATHRWLDDAFGYGNLESLEHLALMMRRDLAVAFGGEDAYTNNPERLALPIHFLAGERNYIFKPSGTQATLDWLRSNNDPSLYSCTWLADYAHLDGLIGTDAVRDVYPAILAHLERTPALPTPRRRSRRPA